MKTILLTTIFIGLLIYSDKVLYDIGYKNGAGNSDNKWQNELIVKNYAGYGEKDGVWNYLKESDVLLRLLIQFNEKPAEKKSFKLELNAEPIAEKDYLAENDKFSLTAPLKSDKTKKK